MEIHPSIPVLSPYDEPDDGSNGSGGGPAGRHGCHATRSWRHRRLGPGHDRPRA
jgi:hypothetical protein